MTEAELFAANYPTLCHCLRWKGQFVWADHDPSVPPAGDANYWCVFTQTCLGPDGQLAEPATCGSTDRGCYGTGNV